MASIFKSPFLSIAGQKERLLNVVGTVNAAFNPLSKATVTANVSNPTMKSALETVSNHPYVSAGVIAGGITAIAKPAAALALAKKAIPTTLKGKVIAAVAAPVVIGAVSKAPIQSAKAIISAPSQLSEFGGGIAQLATKPSLESAKALFKESPILTGASLAAIAVVAGKGIFPAIATARQTEAIQEQTEAIKGVGAVLPTEQPNYTTAPVGKSPSPSVPVTPQTQTIMAGTKKKYKRKASKKVMPTGNISQRVNVLVANRNTATAKRYISKEVLAY